MRNTPAREKSVIHLQPIEPVYFKQDCQLTIIPKTLQHSQVGDLLIQDQQGKRLIVLAPLGIEILCRTPFGRLFGAKVPHLQMNMFWLDAVVAKRRMMSGGSFQQVSDQLVPEPVPTCRCRQPNGHAIASTPCDLLVS